ncbi:SUN domain-containing protein 2 isoform X1 [Drosophila rhopaloa]|uniref:SUN domain-containing protein 2 isoform X1 n=1 Tax=Drosophila rhopaloa TaxID=1041015 RepID=A0A6P4EVP4_DRORH|nr:SUN domain-containing protein 2 isoform X1 [Drosophila rhopaloa]
MDGCQRAGKRVCLTYVLSFVLLSAFFYYLMAHNSRNNMGIVRLREDVDDISHMLRQQQMESKGAQISNCLGGEPKGMGSGSGRCDNREVTAYVDTLFKRKMGHLMDDVYNLKKQVMSADCSARVGQSAPKSETVSVGKARINYASEELGARIIDVKAPPIGGTNVIKTLLGLDFSANPPVNMLRPALTPGSCFGFSGSRATVILHLAKSIVVEAISLTHVAREMTPTLCVKSAPKEFDVVCYWTIPSESCWDSGPSITRPTGALRPTVYTTKAFFGGWPSISTRTTARIPPAFIVLKCLGDCRNMTDFVLTTIIYFVNYFLALINIDCLS